MKGQGALRAVGLAAAGVTRTWLGAGMLGALGGAAEIALALGFAALAAAGPGERLGPVLAAIALSAALRSTVQAALAHLASSASIEASRALRRVGLDALLLADARALEPATEALTRWLDRVPRAAQARQALVALAAHGAQALGLAALVLAVAPGLGAAMLGVLAATAALAAVVVRRLRTLAIELQPSQRQIVAILERASRHALAIRALRTVDAERARLADAVERHAALQRRVALGHALASVSPVVPAVIGIAALASLAPRVGLATGDLVAMLYALVRLASSLSVAGHAIGVIAAAAPALAALADEPRLAVPAPRPVGPPGPPCEVVLDDLSAEIGGRVVLSGIALRIAPGEVVALTGPSGVGKTTLLRAVLGLLEPHRGEVRIAGLAPSAWLAAGGRLGLAGAEPLLFAGTLRENLRYGEPAPLDDDALVRALARVKAADLARGTQGLDRRIGEGGEGLSSGERQRVALARAIASDPALLVLDEPTSGLDVLLEGEVAALLRSLAGRCTVLLATHRAPLLAVCDRVLELVPGPGGATMRAQRRA